MGEIYLDSASTTKLRPEVVGAMLPYLTEEYHNPSSLYSSGASVKDAIESARKTIGKFINANPSEIYFTSGASESNCTALLGFVLHQYSTWRDAYIITTKIEHKSIMSCTKAMDKALLCAVSYLNVDSSGFVDVDRLISLIETSIDAGRNPHDVLVSVMYANNEIGTIQDIKRISEIVHNYGCLLHVDATQAFGAVPIDVEELQIDMLSASAHKIGGPKGTGILYKRDGVDINPIIYGNQMGGMRGGTENVAGIIGMAKAVEVTSDNIDNQWKIINMRNHLMQKLRSIGCMVNGDMRMRLPNNVNVILPDGASGEAMLYCLDIDGIEISTGSACNSHSIEPSYVLKAIGLTDEEAARSIRITISEDVSDEQIQYVVDEMEKAIKILGSEN